MRTRTTLVSEIVRPLTLLSCIVGILCFTDTRAQSAPPPPSKSLQARIDGIVKKALADSGIPSVSIAVVKDAQLAFTGAYGSARMQPRLAAQPEMR